MEKIRDILDGETKKIYVLLKDMEDTIDKNGKPYMRLAITDGEDEVVAFCFTKTCEKYTARGLKPGIIIRIELTKKGQFYNFNNLYPNDNAEITAADFIKTAPINFEDAFSEIINTIETCGEETMRPVQIITSEILNSFHDNFIRLAGAQKMHHNYVGGLLYHALYMVRTAESLCSVYKELNKVVLVCAAALHDIGKIKELETDATGNTEYTIDGRLFGHLMLGSLIIYDAYKDKYPDDKECTMLLHMVASHHGKQEWGAIAKPAFAEAYVLHMIDIVDSRIRMFDEEYQKIEKGKIAAQKNYGLDTFVYRP